MIPSPPSRIHAGLTAAIVLAALAVAAVPGLDAVEVVIVPGQSIQAAVDANPGATTFRLRAGVHLRQSVLPRAGQRFIGDGGAIMDGGGTVEYAFMGDVAARPAGVRIENLVIQRYNPPLHFGAIRIGGHGTGQGGIGWVIDACVVRDNAMAAIRTGDGARITRCRLLDNGWNGLIGTGDGMLIEGNEIAGNNWKRLEDGGAGKLVVTRGLVVRGNHSHHNHGPGIWTDINNIDTLYENNVIVDNAGMGIFHEISYRATIRNNFVARNGGDATWLWGAGILVSESPDVEVHGNTVIDNASAICAKQQIRGEPALHGTHDQHDLWVHHNVVRMRRGHNGVAHDVPGGAIYFGAEKSNRFDWNTYHIGSLAAPFHWSEPWSTPAMWQGYGQDLNGTFVRAAVADIAAPTVALRAPYDGAVARGAVRLGAFAADDVAVVGVRFLVDGVVVGESRTAPFEVVWDSATARDGEHRVSALAWDAAGGTARSPAWTITVAGGVPPGGDAIVTGAWCKLVAKHSGKCLDVAGASRANGADVVQWTDNGTSAQQWRIDALSDGTYTLTARCSGQALDVGGAATADGGDAIQWPAHGGANQRWRIEPVGGGCYRLVAAHSGKVLDVAGASTVDGADVIQWSEHGSDNQRWAIVPQPPSGSG
ncbi:MAG TPA: RICIN domain-containing protein [Planctomycetota bacterium]|nr:RICIN domain-containing protein [Planctomycetota bacterium]